MQSFAFEILQLCHSLSNDETMYVFFSRRGAEGPCNFYAFTTNNYKLHFFETATGLRLLLTTDESAGDLRAFMKHIYSNIYIEYIVKNAALEPMKPFASDAFTAALDAYTALL